MASYGNRDQYTFKTNDGTYYPSVDANTGKIKVTRIGQTAGDDREVGTIDPGSSKMNLTGNANNSEKNHFSNPNNVKAVKNQAEITVTKELQKSGTSLESSKTKASQLLKTGKSTSSDNSGISGSLDSELKGSNKTRNEFPGKGGVNPLVYPEKLLIEDQDVVKFSMYKYQPKKLSNNSNTFGPSERTTKGRSIIGTAILPIQAGIQDFMSVSWGENEMTALELMAANIARQSILKGVEGTQNSTEEALTDFKSSLGDARAGLAGFFTEQATGVTGILQRTEGAITNKNLELLFNKPSLRPFAFNFRLSPRSPEESQRVKKIIRFFKQGMSPQKSQSNLFLKSPHTFKIEYLHKGELHKYLNIIKECALLDFTVDYTPETNYATFVDGAMVSYIITMKFSELEPIYNEDYNDISDEYIGY